uniref:TLC domain-containing protein n=1 Tax=Macrostomum lignano TaxID=282301 RepID=A0A1I8IHX1_9PLAT
KDFFEMVLHHVVTIWLLVFSWSTNFVRVGSLVLLVHDVVDPFLQGAKVFKYLGMQSLCNLSFTLFTLGWLLTRLSAYPLVILRSSLWQSVEEFGMFPAHLLFNGALILLQCLHIVWFYFIVKILIRSLRVGKVVNDTRSDSEQSDCSDDEPHSPVANGAQAVRRRHRNGLAKNSST